MWGTGGERQRRESKGARKEDKLEVGCHKCKTNIKVVRGSRKSLCYVV